MASASDEPDSDEETAVSGPKHLVGDAAHPELGKVSVTVTKLAEEADEGGTGDTASGGKEGKSSSKDPVLNLTETQAPQDAAVAKTSDVQPAAQAATPISNDQPASRGGDHQSPPGGSWKRDRRAQDRRRQDGGRAIRKP